MRSYWPRNAGAEEITTYARSRRCDRTSAQWGRLTEIRFGSKQNLQIGRRVHDVFGTEIQQVTDTRPWAQYGLDCELRRNCDRRQMKTTMALLTSAQVAELLHVSKGWVSAHSTGGRQPALPYIDLGGSKRFQLEDVQAFLRQNTRNA
jgi:hypothetical protein